MITFFPIRQSINLLVRAYLVSNATKGAEEPWRRDDAKETTDVYNAIWASRIFRPEHAAGEDELYRKESRPLSNEQQR